MALLADRKARDQGAVVHAVGGAAEGAGTV